MTAPDRENARLRFARQALDRADLTLLPASSDASFRSYWRTAADASGRTWIVMDAPPDREDLAPWLDVAERLRRAGLNAPDALAVDREQGFALISDLGQRPYLPELTEATVELRYGEALDALFAMQTRVEVAGLPEYDEARLVEEMELMPTWFLRRHLGIELECEQWDIVESAFRALADSALAQPKTFVHRDYHSRNLMIGEPGPGIIDFQDAVRGPIAYDLASLLRDCYVAWPAERVYGWVESHRHRLAEAGRLPAVDGARFRRWFDLMGLQRHLKVLGIFCRLWYRDGKPGYLKDLPRVWRYTREVGSEYEATRPLIALLEGAIAAAGPLDAPRPAAPESACAP